MLAVAFMLHYIVLMNCLLSNPCLLRTDFTRYVKVCRLQHDSEKCRKVTYLEYMDRFVVDELIK
jgi:hypothetical protein